MRVIILCQLFQIKQTQLATLCGKAADNLKDSFENYSLQDTRLDDFYYNIIGDNSDFTELWSVHKCVLVLSHGNANVESGFSVNGGILVENLHEESLIAQRQVYDAVLACGGVAAVEVDKSLLQYVRGSHFRYQECLRKKRMSIQDEEQKASDRKRAADQIKVLKAKKNKMAQTVALESNNIDRDIADLEKMLKK